MKELFILAAAALTTATGASAQTSLYHGWWQGNLIRTDGQPIVFNFEVKDSIGKPILYIRNAGERLLVDEIQITGDSVNIKMPFFEAGFKAKIETDGRLTGLFVKRGATADRLQPFVAYPKKEERFELTQGPASMQITGRYAVRFLTSRGQTADTAVGEFTQQGNAVTGTFLTPSGDYRFLEGVLTGDSLKVSTFDGSHCYVFTAKVNPDHSLDGRMYASASPSTEWRGTWNPKAGLPMDADKPKLIDPAKAQLHFSFPNLDSQMVSVQGFKGKVVVITIMGSWCPNCMDETQFLSAWYDRNKDRGVAVLGLAYERTTNFQRSKQGLLTFKNRFNVHYPFLITGVTVADPDKAKKTLPEIDAINAFPTMIILDKKGNVRLFRAGFEGPGTGEHYQLFQQQFNGWVDQLLAEKS